jgi:hypothetical protein
VVRGGVVRNWGELLGRRDRGQRPRLQEPAELEVPREHGSQVRRDEREGARRVPALTLRGRLGSLRWRDVNKSNRFACCRNDSELLRHRHPGRPRGP